MGVSSEEKSTLNNSSKGERVVNKVKDDFVAPDGGWGWIIVLAAGFCNLCLFMVIQNFGLIFREYFDTLGITTAQTTTIANVNLAVTSLIGLANGPLFRRFTFRQIALFGSMVAALSIMALSTATTFGEILFYMGVVNGAGSGVTMSAHVVALNTYFKKKRRLAVGLSWTCTGLGPIIMPQIITTLVPIYDVPGAVLILGAFATHGFALALLLHPVTWHMKKLSVMDELRAEAAKEKSDIILTKGMSKQTSALSIENIKEKLANLGDSRQGFGSQFLYYDDEEEGASGMDVMPIGSPMMSRANDGWFSRKNSTASIASNKTLKHENSQVRLRKASLSSSRAPSMTTLATSPKSGSKLTNENEINRRRSSLQINTTTPLIIVKESSENGNSDETPRENDYNKDEEYKNIEFEEDKVEEPPRSLYQKIINAIVIFFDLDLLRDKVFVNIMLGCNFANFTELNFALIVPYLLEVDYGFKKREVAMFMSVLAAVDVIGRTTISFITSKIPLSNRTFFLIGIGMLGTGRLALSFARSYPLTLVIAVYMGLGKSLRTIFIALVIPSHVPLSRLPAATGLQLLTSGIIMFSMGPLVGVVKDIIGSYSLLLHALNVPSFLVILSWLIERWITTRCGSKEQTLDV